MRYPADGNFADLHRELRRRVEALISNGELYFPTAAELNDPFEGSPHFRAPEGSPQEVFERYSGPLRQTYAPELGWNEAQVREAEESLRERIRTGELAAIADTMEAKWRPRLRTEYPMQCFGATRENIQMWSYYAEGHTGVCVHFDATIAPTGAALRVNYSNDYPILPLPLADFPPDLVVRLALGTKARAWEHEQEYRLINFPNAEPRRGRVLDDVLSWRSEQLAILPAQHLVGVTVGASMPDEQIESILRLCHDRGARIPVYRAAPHRNQFALRFETI